MKIMLQGNWGGYNQGGGGGGSGSGGSGGGGSSGSSNWGGTGGGNWGTQSYNQQGWTQPNYSQQGWKGKTDFIIHISKRYLLHTLVIFLHIMYQTFLCF
jgi:hypothetical protein